ncbi:MAG TPA: ASCH domain-containing protein [Candidatus Bathyarchaeia archaeon]|nr:ASCH domain-containing protein [Candidatus Bathyarchaeia archaeon]
MKCLSVSQPYADFIIEGKKTIELRRWNTMYRGEFLIHAPLKVNKEACKRLKIKEDDLRTGVIIGKVEIYDVKVYTTIAELKSDYTKHFAGKEYLHHKYGFLLRNAQSLKVPIPCKGSLGFFEFKPHNAISDNAIRSELFDEEYRYQWIGKH